MELTDWNQNCFIGKDQWCNVYLIVPCTSKQKMSLYSNKNEKLKE